MKIIKWILYLLADILMIGCYAGACLFQNFTKKKLGMLRWLNFTETRIMEKVPIDILKYVVPIIVLVIAILVAKYYISKRKTKHWFAGAMVLVMLVVSLFYLGFTVTQSTGTYRAYYFMLPCIGAAALVQLIKTVIGVKICNRRY